MSSRLEFPAQTLSVLAALYDQLKHWQDGSALARQMGLTAERLRPILSQLAARGLAQIAGPGSTPSG
jgi:DNA-binding MarR family transcriptional regulator